MQTQANFVAREILFQGEHVGAKLPKALVDALELYEAMYQVATGGDLDGPEVARFITFCVMAYNGKGVFSSGDRMMIPTRKEIVYFVRPAPWDCSVVKNAEGRSMIVMNSRMELMQPLVPKEDDPEPEPFNKKAKKELASAAA